MLTGSSSADVQFAIERCWALIADVDRAPLWQRTLVSLDVVERDERGRALICDTVTDAKLAKIGSRVRMTYDEPRALRWTQVESGDLESMDGAWELDPLGPALTRATYTLTVDPGPVGFLARPLERTIRSIVIGHQAGELQRALEAGL